MHQLQQLNPFLTSSYILLVKEGLKSALSWHKCWQFLTVFILFDMKNCFFTQKNVNKYCSYIYYRWPRTTGRGFGAKLISLWWYDFHFKIAWCFAKKLCVNFTRRIKLYQFSCQSSFFLTMCVNVTKFFKHFLGKRHAIDWETFFTLYWPLCASFNDHGENNTRCCARPATMVFFEENKTSYHWQKKSTMI